MKEYKVVSFKSPLTFNMEKYLEDLNKFLNSYAKQGWRVIESKEFSYFILERDK